MMFIMCSAFSVLVIFSIDMLNLQHSKTKTNVAINLTL